MESTVTIMTGGISRRGFLLATGIALVGRGPTQVRARQATPMASAGEPLLEATFTAAELPTAAQAFFYRLTLPPDETLSSLAGPFCGCGAEQIAPGVGAEMVQSGTYALRLAAPFRVHRAGGTDEEVAAEAEVVLEPGDAAIFPDYAAAGEIRAAGAEPAVVVGIAIVAVAGLGTPAPSIPLTVEAEQLSTLRELGWGDIATGEPVTIRLQRVELPAGAALGPYETAGAEAMLVETGQVGGSILPPGETSPPGTPLAYEAGSTVPFLTLRPGNRRLVSNTGDGPAMLLMASIGPEGGASPLSATSG